VPGLNLNDPVSVLATNILTSDRSGSKFLWLGSGSHLWFGFEFQKFPLKMSNFSNFTILVKKNLFGSGRVGKYPGRPIIYCTSKLQK